MLHIVNKSPFERNTLESCLRLATKGSAVLLTEDAVYAATTGSAAEGKIKAAMADLVQILRPVPRSASARHGRARHGRGKSSGLWRFRGSGDGTQQLSILVVTAFH